MAGQGKTAKGGTKQLVGISYPFRKDKGRFPAVDIDGDAVKNDIISLFKTKLRSRVMRPLFGQNTEALVFESKGPLLYARVERSIRQVMLINEPRVNVLAVEVDDTNDTTLTALVSYEIKGIRDFVELKFLKQNGTF